MEFEEFKEKIVEGLQEIYGGSAELDTDVVKKNNGSKYNGIMIRLKDTQSKAAPVIELDSIYEAFESGKMDIEDCVREVYRQRESLRSFAEMEAFAESVKDWDQVRDKIYPILLSTKENKELLENLVSTPMLDLSIVYAIRSEMAEGSTMSIKITKNLLESYVIGAEQLHQQAMENMAKDGYEFLDMDKMLKEILHMEGDLDIDKPEIYILTNSTRSYGAAGILNKELLQEFARGRNFIILPSSVHESLFVPVTGEPDQALFDGMVSEVNETQVSVEERLSDHSYYYDAETGEIRMCA